jgi:plastocyanin
LHFELSRSGARVRFASGVSDCPSVQERTPVATHLTFRSFLVCAAALAATACGGSKDGPTGAPARAIQKTASASGDGQTGTVSTALANPLRVLVTLDSVPQVGDTVTWAAGGTGASVSPTTSVTGAGGIATTTWTLGTTVGAQSATATLAGATGSPVTFGATASATPVPVIAKTVSASGDAQAGTVATALANPLRVLVTLSGAPVAGDTVTWGATGTGASVAPVKAVTDASGIATTTWTLGQTAGVQSATATLAAASGSPVSFSAVANAGAATQLAVAAGDGQTGSPNAALATQLAAKVSDQFGNGVAGVAVTWQVTGGTGGVNPTSGSTDGSGLAKTTLTLGATNGPVTITATSVGLAGSPATFHATIASAAASAAVQVGDTFFKSGHNATQNPAVDTVGVGGTVTWTWVGSLLHSVESTGASSFTTSSTKTTGTYGFTFTTAGTYTYDCGVHGAAMKGTIVVR